MKGKNTHEQKPCNRWRSTHTHTHTGIFLINNILNNSCKLKIARKVFCAQNLIRDG